MYSLSLDFKKAAWKEATRHGGIDVFHDAVVEATDKDFTEAQLASMFYILPDELILLAVQWGICDTQFRDDMFLHVKEIIFVEPGKQA